MICVFSRGINTKSPTLSWSKVIILGPCETFCLSMVLYQPLIPEISVRITFNSFWCKWHLHYIFMLPFFLVFSIFQAVSSHIPYSICHLVKEQSKGKLAEFLTISDGHCAGFMICWFLWLCKSTTANNGPVHSSKELSIESLSFYCFHQCRRQSLEHTLILVLWCGLGR